MIISEEQSRALRRKQADKMLTSQSASKEIGIHPITYKKLITCGNVKDTIYVKAING